MRAIRHRATAGTSGALSWGAGWHPNGLARDLRPDEARGATWTSEPLAAPLEIIGIPTAVLHLSATMPVATCVVRLSEVSPEGVSALVATGVLNLTHRRSDTDPEPLEPGRIEEVTVPLRATGYRFSPGHRIRLTVLTGYWPALWPSPLPGIAARPPREGHAVPAPPPGPSGGRHHPRAARVQADRGRPARGRRERGRAGHLADRGGRDQRHGDGDDRRGRGEHPRGRIARVQLGDGWS